MARPSKAAAVMTGKIGKEQREKRIEEENRIKGNCDKLVPQEYLTDDQKKLFQYIMKELEESKILGNLDLFVLSKAAITIDRVQKMEQKINESENLELNNTFRSTLDMYSKEFFRCCNELCLSPQARAKIAGMKIVKQEEDPVRKVLSDN